MIKLPFSASLVDRCRKALSVEAHVLSGRPEAAAIEIEGAHPSVLCIHGFTGVPQEVAIGCEVAQGLGLRARAPCLRGHGSSSDELARTRYQDWYQSVVSTFDDLRKTGPVIVVGLSLGSIIATELVLSAPGDVSGLVLLANAFWLQAPYPAWGLDLADRFDVPDFSVKKGASDYGDEQAGATHVSYNVQPIRAAASVLRAGQRVRQELHRVHCPTLILHGAKDRVCPVENSWRVAEMLGTTQTQVVVLPRSHHIVTRDRERDQVRSQLRSFFQRCASGRSVAS